MIKSNADMRQSSPTYNRPTFRINDLNAREFSSHRFLNKSMCFNSTACKFQAKI